MLQENKHWSSGNWQVSGGKAEEFVERWREFLTWTKEANDGFLGARLMRDLANPDHFLSVASWQDLGAMRSWQEKPEFGPKIAACRVLCDDMQAAGFELVVDI